jgi:hypothetical protein
LYKALCSNLCNSWIENQEWNKTGIMKKLATKTLCLLVTATVFFASCKKERIIAPGQTAKQLQVTLNENYLPAAKVDSAVAIWEVNGTTQTVNLQLTDNKLTTSLANLKNNGTGKLAIQLFTQTKVGEMPLQWENRFTYTLNRTTPVSLAAPADIKDPSWHPRAICKSDIYNGNFTAIIAIRPEDAYFELKEIAPGLAKRIEVVRSFYQNDTTHLVASRGWVGNKSNLDAKGNLVDREHFSNLPEQIGERSWNKYKIRATFYANTNPQQIYESEFEQNKP